MPGSYTVVDKRYNSAYTVSNDRPFRYEFNTDTPANLFYQAPQHNTGTYDLSNVCQGRNYDSLILDDLTNTPTTNKMIVRTRPAVEARFSTEEVGQIILQDVRDGHTVKSTLEELESVVKWVKSENRKKVVEARKKERAAKRSEIQRIKTNIAAAKSNLKSYQHSLRDARS